MKTYHGSGHCGINVYTTRDVPGSGPFVAVTIASLDDMPVDDMRAAPVRYIDGRKANWREAPAEIRHL